MTCAEYRKILEHLEYATVEEVALALIHLMDCAECKREGAERTVEVCDGR